MNTKWILRLLIACLAMIALFAPRLGESCGPFIPQVVFVHLDGPDRPMSSFANGRIGIVRPTWYRAYLVVAYRYLENKPLSADEQSALLKFWDIDHTIGPKDRTEEAVKLWATTRGRYAPNEASADARVNKFDAALHSEVPNCLAPAFFAAAETLEDRARRLGGSSRDLREWIAGQDAVFSNCHQAGRLPGDLPDTANPLLRADRAYQTAAAEFYRGEFEDAAQRFEAIAKDEASPWHVIAPYLNARALIRRAATAAPANQTYDLAGLASAEACLTRILNDPKQQTVHADAQALLGLVSYRLHPDRRRDELGKTLAEGRSGSQFGQDLRDYTWLMQNFSDTHPAVSGFDTRTPGGATAGTAPQLQTKSASEPPRLDDLSDWVMTMQSGGPAAREHALARWRATNSVPWLVAAMQKVNEKDGGIDDLTKAAADIPQTSAAYPTVAYDRARLEGAARHDAEARLILKQALALDDRLPPSAAHLLQDQQLALAADFQEFQSRLWQTPLALDWGFDMAEDNENNCYAAGCNETFYGSAKPAKGAEFLPQFTPLAAMWLNSWVPLVDFIRAANSRSLPGNLRRRMAPAAWVRAALLDQRELAARVADAAIAAQPALRPYVESYAKAATKPERRFAAVFAVLHFPGLRPYVNDADPRTTPFEKIDNYRDNWWCQDAGGSTQDDASKSQLGLGAESTKLAVPYPGFLTSDEKTAAAKERRELSALGAGSEFLPRTVVAWATAHPDDPRVPEALHLAVRSTRYGCNSGNPSQYGHQAFNLLHRKYPQSEWAKKTPLWF